jgi:acyl carrier protein
LGGDADIEPAERAVVSTLTRVARERRPQLPEIGPGSTLSADLGLDSLDFAQVVALLEQQLGVDPFASTATLSGVRTVKDLVEIYRRAIGSKHGP